MSTRTPGKHAAPRRLAAVLPAMPGTTSRGRHARRADRSPSSLVAVAPRLVGAAALAVATCGAMNVAPPSAVSALAAGDVGAAAGGRSSDTPALSGAPNEILRVDARPPRAQRVSRDSSRQALADAAGTDLQRPAGAQAKGENAEIARLAADAEKAAAEITRSAWHLPLAAASYRLSGRFGECGSLWAHCHTGLDFAVASGTPTRAVAAGVVTESGWAGAYGNRLVLTLEDGTEIWYCHLTSFAVGVGETVAGGQVVGLVGSTGNSTGPHLHLEVRPGGGDAVDPYTALSVKGRTP